MGHDLLSSTWKRRLWRILSLISRLKIGLWWQGREDPKVLSNSHLKNLKGKRPNVAHTFEGVDESLGDILDPAKSLLAGSKQLTRRNLQVFLDARGWRRVSDVSENRSSLSARQTWGNESRQRSPKNTHTWNVTVRTSVSNVWQTPRYQFNSRQYQASKVILAPLTWFA